MSQTITLKSPIDGFEFTALHAMPAHKPIGGVIVIQEIFGLDDFIQADVKRWADAGYEVVAPSMFDRQERGFTALHDEAGFEVGFRYAKANGADNALADIQACIDFLSPKGPVFIVGYCYGGTFSWLAAGKLSGLSAASCYYGGSIPQHLDVTPKCPTILHFGAKDPYLPLDDVEPAIKAAHPEVPLYVYENSGHGFNNDGRPDSNKADADLARQRTRELFAANAG